MVNASWITLVVVCVALATKIFSWYIDKPRRLAELRKRENEILDDLRWATVHLDTRRMALLERQLCIVRKSIAVLDGK